MVFAQSLDQTSMGWANNSDASEENKYNHYGNYKPVHKILPSNLN
jgi:hypothetical protein